jgi:kinesin family protein 5
MGQTLEEAKKINKSLSALGNVINTLSENKSSHIPYRDSKLTRILQESLGGNSRTSLIINCSPSSLNNAETLSTLRFGTRAKKIQNAPHINTELSTSALKKKVKQLEALNEQNQSYIMELEQEVYRLREAEPPSPTPVVSEKSSTLKGDLFAASMKPVSTPLTNLHNQTDELDRRDNRIAELEDQILSMKLENLRNNHTEDSKLFVLENSLCKLNDKLTEVEMININLRKHLLMSEKIIESRDVKVNKLKAALKEQQEFISKQTVGFKYKLGDIQSKLEFYNQQKHPRNDIMNRQSSLSSEKDESLKHESYPEILKPAPTTA